MDLCRNILRFVEDMDFERFEASLEKQFAVTHALFLLGEASKTLSTETTTAAPEIDWRALARMRDRLAHHYWTVANRIVWDAATTNVPELLKFLERAVIFGRRHSVLEDQVLVLISENGGKGKLSDADALKVMLHRNKAFEEGFRSVENPKGPPLSGVELAYARY